MPWSYEKMKNEYDSINIRSKKGYRDAVEELAEAERRTVASYVRNLIAEDAEKKGYPLKDKIKYYRHQYEQEEAKKAATEESGGRESPKNSPN